MHHLSLCSIRNSQSSVSQCSATRSCQTTCGPNLTPRWRSRRSSWVLKLHVLVQRWRRYVSPHAGSSDQCHPAPDRTINITMWYSSQQKQIQTLNKLCSSLLEKLNNPRDDRDAESAGTLRLHRPLPLSEASVQLGTSCCFSWKIVWMMFFSVAFQPYDRTNRLSTPPTPTH